MSDEQVHFILCVQSSPGVERWLPEAKRLARALCAETKNKERSDGPR